MARQIQNRRGTKEENDNFTGAEGEITIDTTNSTIRVHDGQTTGGTELLTKKDTSWISNQSKPSTSTQEITLGASGASYVAPANGRFTLRVNRDGPYNIYMDGRYRSSFVCPSGTYAQGTTTVSILKGQSCAIYYGGFTPSDVLLFRFIYDEGDK